MMHFTQAAPEPVAAILNEVVLIIKRARLKSFSLKSLRRVLIAGLAIAAFIPASAGATTFNVEGLWDRGFLGAGGSFSGTMDIDTVAGEITSVNIAFPDFPTLPAFTNILSQGPSSGQWLTSFGNGRLGLFNQEEYATFAIVPSPGVGSLVGFESGVIRQGNSGFLDTGTSIKLLQDFQGNITPAAVSVPEPATLGMFGLGLLMLGGFVTLRRLT